MEYAFRRSVKRYDALIFLLDRRTVEIAFAINSITETNSIHDLYVDMIKEQDPGGCCGGLIPQQNNVIPN